MQRITPQHITGLTLQNDRAIPTGASVECPGCAHLLRVRFSKEWLPGVIYDDSCGCGARLHFVLIEASKATHDLTQWDGELWMHPPARRSRQPIAIDASPKIPDGLKSEYIEAIDHFNKGKWRAAAGAARVVVEGLARQVTGQPRKMLGELKAALIELGYTGPIADVTEVLREGGNFASHWDGRAITRPVAEHMLDLAEAWIEYMFLIPEQVARAGELLADPDSYVDLPSDPADADRALSVEDRVARLSAALDVHWPDTWEVAAMSADIVQIMSTDIVRLPDFMRTQIIRLAIDHGFHDPKINEQLPGRH